MNSERKAIDEPASEAPTSALATFSIRYSTSMISFFGDALPRDTERDTLHNVIESTQAEIAAHHQSQLHHVDRRYDRLNYLKS